jgi:putative transcriptional regulator
MSLDINKLLQQSALEMVDIDANKLEAKEHKIFISSGLDVVKIRKQLGITRAVFCERFGLKIRTVEKWEQNKNQIDSTARSFLTAIANNPKAIEEALR